MRKINKYTVTGLLGKGGMGKVYKIKYPVTGKTGALKQLDPNPLLTAIMGQEAVEALFTREAVTMAGIRHSNILEIFDFDRAGGKLYYTMDFYGDNLGLIMGESMETERPTRPLGVVRTLGYARQILDGLGCLHWNGIIHRDIKPFNMMLTETDTIKIGDFGLSKLRGEPLNIHGSVKVGSPYYAAPEQEKDPEAADEISDLYSVGVMLFRMVTGRLPQGPKDLSSRHFADLDHAWDQFFHRAIHPDRSCRFRSAAEMVQALDRLERQWHEKKARICTLPEALEDKNEKKGPGSPFISPRKQPVKIREKDAQEQFGLDALMMPQHYFNNDFRQIAPDRIQDHATGLEWQQSGTPYPVDWPTARSYITRLNKKEPDRHLWRLPTIAELATLLSPLPQGTGHCVEPLFDTRQTALWSADRCSWISAWYVNLEMGFVGKNDFSSYYHVKAVRRFRGSC